MQSKCRRTRRAFLNVILSKSTKIKIIYRCKFILKTKKNIIFYTEAPSTDQTKLPQNRFPYINNNAHNTHKPARSGHNQITMQTSRAEYMREMREMCAGEKYTIVRTHFSGSWAFGRMGGEEGKISEGEFVHQTYNICTLSMRTVYANILNVHMYTHACKKISLETMARWLACVLACARHGHVLCDCVDVSMRRMHACAHRLPLNFCSRARAARLAPRRIYVCVCSCSSALVVGLPGRGTGYMRACSFFLSACVHACSRVHKYVMRARWPSACTAFTIDKLQK